MARLPSLAASLRRRCHMGKKATIEITVTIRMLSKMEAKNDLIQNVRSKKLMKTISEKVDNNELPLDLRSPSAKLRNDELFADLSDLLKVTENIALEEKTNDSENPAQQINGNTELALDLRMPAAKMRRNLEFLEAFEEKTSNSKPPAVADQQISKLQNYRHMQTFNKSPRMVLDAMKSDVPCNNCMFMDGMSRRMPCYIFVPPGVDDGEPVERPAEASRAKPLYSGNADFMKDWIAETSIDLGYTRSRAAVEPLLAQTLNIIDSDSDRFDPRMTRSMTRELGRASAESYEIDEETRCEMPVDAVGLDWKLPPQRVQDGCKIGSIIPISMSCVYTPFQFWFHILTSQYAKSPVAQMTTGLDLFYRTTRIKNYLAPLPSFFYKEGFICAAYSDSGWRRGRVLLTAPLDAAWVYIYYVDHAQSVVLAPRYLRFLPLSFARAPPLVYRGSLTDVLPLAAHWPFKSITAFQRMTFQYLMYGHVIELDAEEGIFYMRLSRDGKFAPTINEDLVKARLAGIRDLHGNRKVRYARELLPSFGMLESRIMPLSDENFECFFDSIIYSESFHRDYQVPKPLNPFQVRLFAALSDWMLTYRSQQEHWRHVRRLAIEWENQGHQEREQEQE